MGSVMKFGRLTGALVALLVTMGSAECAPAAIDAPRAVVKQILAGMTRAGTNLDNPPYHACPNLCDPVFYQIMTRESALQDKDEDAPYDYDVFCSCQDYDHQTFSLVSDRMI